MNLSQFLEKSVQKKPEPKTSLNSLSSLIKPILSQQKKTKETLSPDNALKKLQEKLSKTSSFELKNPEEILSLLKKKIDSTHSTESYIRELGNYQKQKTLVLHENQRYLSRKRRNFFKITDSPLIVFKSKPNNINQCFLLQANRKRKKSIFFFEFEMEIENTQTITQEFLSKGIDFKPLPKRYSFHKLSQSNVPISSKSRLRAQTIKTNDLSKPILSESSSESSEEELPIYYKEKQEYYILQTSKDKKTENLVSDPLTNKDFKTHFAKPLNFMSPKEISNGESVKFGFLWKRIRDSNKFHKR